MFSEIISFFLLLFIGNSLGPLHAPSDITFERTGLSQLGEHGDLLLVSGDFTRLSDSSGLLDGHDLARELLHILKDLSRGVASLGLVLVAREEDELALVLLQPLDIEGEGLLGLVGTAVVNADTDALGKLGVDSSTLKKKSLEDKGG